MSNPNPPANAARAPRWFTWLGCAALALYALFLARHTTVVAGGSDSSGYLNSARLLASGELKAEQRIPAELRSLEQLNRLQFFPHGFWPYEGDPRMAPTYPIGLPLHLAVAGKIAGWTAGPLLVGVGAALAAVALCYAVARELGLDRWLAAAGAVILGAWPVLLFTSIQPLSDTLATAWALGAVWCALRARRRLAWAAACGAVTALAVLVRPTNALLLPALVVLLGLDWRRLGLAFACGLPGALWLAWYNKTLYGGALESGYGDWQTAFALRYAWPTLVHFATWLAAMLPAVLLVLPFAALVRPRGRGRELLALTLWFAGIAGLYACYEVSHEVWWCLRFIAPAVPALILGGLLGLDVLLSRVNTTAWAIRARAIAAVVLVVWAVAGSWYWTKRQGVWLVPGYEQTYADAARAARARFPAGALVVTYFTSGALYYYTDFPVLRWDQLRPGDFARHAAALRAAGRPICALIYDFEEKEALHERCPGEWQRLQRVKNVGLWQLGAAAAAAPSAASAK